MHLHLYSSMLLSLHRKEAHFICGFIIRIPIHDSGKKVRESSSQTVGREFLETSWRKHSSHSRERSRAPEAAWDSGQRAPRY